MAALTLRAPAKLNLFLHITGKRVDGYHTLESLVVFADICDSLRIEAAPELSLSVEGEFAAASGNEQDNLVLRAARVLQQHTGTNHGARIRLTKNIPVGAGLGGGSADAAAALMGLNQLWQLGLAETELHALAVTLGADVAMCLDPKPALVRGIGEEITPLTTALPAMAAVLVHPRVPLLTKHVYGAFRQGAVAKLWDGGQDFWTALAATRNHLQAPAITVSPLVAEVLLALETLQPAPRIARMTGSGACCFALYDTLAEAQHTAGYLALQHAGWWVKAASLRHRF